MAGLTNAIGVIPARLGSTRLPRKPLLPILGIPLIQRVWERASKAASLDALLVATDSEDVKKVVEGFGGKAVMTSPHHESGTDRVAEAVEGLDFSIIVNIQGDEPTLDPTSIDALVQTMKIDPQIKMATLGLSLKDDLLDLDPNAVKVEVNSNSDALRFFRIGQAKGLMKHIGIYAFRKDSLERFVGLERSPGEIELRLEQVRALENGIPIRVIKVENDFFSVDTFHDIAKVESYLMNRQL